MGPWALNAMTAKARTNVSRLLVEGVWDVLVGVGDGVGVGRAVEVAPGAFGEFGVGVVGRPPCAAVVSPRCCATVVVGGGTFAGSTQSSLRLTVRLSYGGVHSHVQLESR